ncbi:hypothetical protein [Enterococcus sp. CSURQ0835]|uniref:hypothetical protein n=1 Tax=Enterococcus sp. CSURQ0835 TaxID=2681394 RepID=UPI00135C9A6D|nr:hypothetical protein [Enterococcus sp. CSURQ0835]
MINQLIDRFNHDPTILTLCENRITSYNYPKTIDIYKPSLLIRPLDAPLDVVYGSDHPNRKEFVYQIVAQSQRFKEVRTIQKAVNQIMNEFGFYQLSGGMDEQNPDSGNFIDGRIYQGRSPLYKTDY